MKFEFIGNVLSVDVDGLKGVNTYTIKAMYNRISADGFADTHFELVDRFSLTWSEINEDGGIGKVNADLNDCYGPFVM